MTTRARFSLFPLGRALVPATHAVPPPPRARQARAALPLAVIALLQTGCARLQTRPGTPDSYETGLWDGGYYAKGGLSKLEWSTSRKAFQEDAKDPDAKHPSGERPPPQYKATDVPTEIWQARGAAWNLHLKYLAASFKAGDVQDAIAVPLVGSAVATAALGIAKSSTVAVAAAGLAAGTITTGYKYAHPDTDLSTDQTAAFALACVVDRSLPLRTLSDVSLVLDKAALQDAVDQLNIESDTSSAATKALDAAKQTMEQLDDKIAAFNDMPSVIYSIKDDIDKTAQTAGARTLNYSSILSDLQAAQASKTANAQTKDTVDQAKKETAKAAGKQIKGKSKSVPAPATRLTTITAEKSPQTDGSDTNASDHTALDNEASDKNASDKEKKRAHTWTALLIPDAHNASNVVFTDASPSGPAAPADAEQSDAGAAGTNELTATARHHTLDNTKITTAQKVAQIAGDANEDLALRDYHIITANIQGCPTNTAAAPLYTLPTTK